MAGPLRSGSLCSGYGGLDLAVTAALGAEPAWVADPGPGPALILAHRYPAARNLRDIRRVDWGQIEPVDVLCAGWPCEPVSQAGLQKGTEDARWLWPYVAAAVRGLRARPRLLVFENVPRLLSIGDGAAFTQVICSLAGLGYVGCYGVFRAADAGAPHTRSRVFIVAADATRRGSGGKPPLVERAEPGDGRGAQPRQAGHVGQAAGNGGVDAGGIQWRKYRQAIHRWERIRGIPAPQPWTVDATGPVQLSALFAEWVMGLDPGWVTQVPALSRKRQLEAIGRGVVPQSAEAAIRYLLPKLPPA